MKLLFLVLTLSALTSCSYVRSVPCPPNSNKESIYINTYSSTGDIVWDKYTVTYKLTDCRGDNTVIMFQADNLKFDDINPFIDGVRKSVERMKCEHK